MEYQNSSNIVVISTILLVTLYYCNQIFSIMSITAPYPLEIEILVVLLVGVFLVTIYYDKKKILPPFQEQED